MDELTLHRYLDGRLDEAQRSAVEAALRADPASRRTLDALREEARLMRSSLEAQSEPPSGFGRVASRVVATLHLEERARIASLRTRTMFRRVVYAASFAAALMLCFLLVRPRTPAGALMSGTHATVTVHGEKRDAQKGLNVYDGDGISTDKGQFVRIGLSNAQTLDIDEFSDVVIEKSGTAPVLRMTRGRLGVTVGDGQNSVQLDVPQGTITVRPGTRLDVWMPERTPVRWPDVFYGAQPVRMPVQTESNVIVTVFSGYAQIGCAKSTASLTVRQGMRALVSKTEIQPRWVNIAGSRVLDVRGDDGLHVRDNVAPVEWMLLGVLEKPHFEALGHRWGLSGADSAGNTRIDESLKQLDAAMGISAHDVRAEKLAEGLQALRQGCEILAQNDDRRRIGLTLEGLAHFEQGCARFAAGGQKGSDPQVSFEAARVAFDAALAGTANTTSDWKTAFSNGTTPTMTSLAPEAQAALTAAFRRALALSWSARIMPSTLDALELSNTKSDVLEKTNPVRVAADAFAQLHDELGHSVEGVAAFLGEAICDIRAGDEASRRRALDSLHVIISKSVSGTDGAIRQTLDGIREAALIELVRMYASGTDAKTTLDAARDYELMFPQDSGAFATKDVRTLLLKGLEAQKKSAFADKRHEHAVDACGALLTALDEAEGHWLDAGQVDSAGNVRHVGERLDRLEALVGAKDWLRASAEAQQLNGRLPVDLQPRYNTLDLEIRKHF